MITCALPFPFLSHLIGIVKYDTANSGWNLYQVLFFIQLLQLEKYAIQWVHTYVDKAFNLHSFL